MLKSGASPEIALAITEKSFAKTIKPLQDFVGEMDSLKSVTEAYNKELIQSKKKMAEIEFIPKNYKQIETEVKSGLKSHFESINESLNNELYVQQAKNQFSEEANVNLMLGVTSFRNLIYFYRDLNCIKPFVADAFINILKNMLNIDSAAPFYFHKFSNRIALVRHFVDNEAIKNLIK